MWNSYLYFRISNIALDVSEENITSNHSETQSTGEHDENIS